MANAYVNKVALADGTSIIDISDTTAVASDVLSGKYFYTADGAKVQGTATGAGAVSVVDTLDAKGGTIRTITAVNISDTTATAADVASGKYFYTANGTKTAGTATGSSADYPEFTLNWDSSGNLTSATCNKTFSECQTILRSVHSLAAVAKNVRPDRTDYDPITFFNYNWNDFFHDNDNNSLMYVLVDQGTFFYFIYYASNGTITYSKNDKYSIITPTFRAKVNSSTGALYDLTCDQTFSECYQLMWLSAEVALMYYDNEYSNWFHGGSTYANITQRSSTSMTWQVMYDSEDIANYEITYTSSGSPTLTADPVSTRTSSDLTASGDTVTVPAGYYASQATKAVSAGTAGTPTATKGSVSNNSIAVTPSVTNTTGYITGGTQTGTAVIVSASELVSGSETKTQNGTYDVTNLAQLVVNVPNNIVVSDIANSTGTTAVITGDQVDLITKTITLNGTYSATDDNADGYSAVTVNVQNGASTSNVQNNYGTEVVVTSASGAGPSATQHTIYFEFTDETNETVYAYYDDAFVGNAITATTPATKGQKTVTLAQLDGVTWYSYSPSQETWETLFNDNVAPNADSPYNYFWISSLSDLYPVVGEVYRVTVNGTEYRCTAYLHTSINLVSIGNPKYSGGTDDGSSAPFNFYNAGWGALVGDTELVAATYHAIKIERLVTED